MRHNYAARFSEQYRQEIMDRVLIMGGTNLRRVFGNPRYLNFENTDFDKLLRKRRISPERYSTLLSMKKCLDEIYPNRYEIRLNNEASVTTHTNQYGTSYGGETDYCVFNGFKMGRVGKLTIHFPEIIIRNRNNRSETLKDMYVRINFHLSEAGIFSIDYMCGELMNPTANQYKSGYQHSHLSNMGEASTPRGGSMRSEIGFDYGFCTGEGDIVAAGALLEGGFNEEYFTLWLLQIETYLSYESLEGGPFTTMSEISDKGSSRVERPSSNVCRIIFNRLISNIKNHIDNGLGNPALDWNYSEDKYRIIDNQKFEDLFDFVREDYPDFFYIRGRNGTVYNSGILREDCYDQPGYWFMFKDQRIHLRVQRNAADDFLAVEKKYIHPEIKNYVKSRIEEQAPTCKIRGSAIARITSYRNTRLRIRQNQVSL